MSLLEPTPWLVLLAGAHLGFQLTVDRVVHPAPAEVGHERGAGAHAAHSRRITPVGAVISPPLVLVVAWQPVAPPAVAAGWLAAAGTLVAVVPTALVAAPAPGRLGRGPDEQERARLLRRLARADHVRTAGALVAAAGAVHLLA
ncbi:hypothetical protein [Janibacter melonis]|uniref:hypothetical protein n=1 Tax=Janibacter melonis TaxID=262209 RepID=UPI002096007F|nr:hypothetical protein [Janibacter melonis]